MRILFFGTYDERAHPRVRALREGLRSRGHDVSQVNRPLGMPTADRVSLLRRPWRAPLLAARLAHRWWNLWKDASGTEAEAVVVGYLGHFDVHLARRRFPDAVIVLDHMVSLGDTARDRGIKPTSPVSRLLDAVDRAALKAADIVVVDTAAQAEALPARAKRVVVVPVTAPEAWAEVDPAPPAESEPHLRVVFLGLFTPLQGATIIGAALARLAQDDRISVTMIGTGQDLASTKTAAAANSRVQWIDWVDSDDLPAVVAGHDVCLGIFGESAKAQRVVPNKVIQGGAAGCAIVTSDTAVQRQTLGEAARYVPAGDPDALAAALATLASDPDHLADLRARALKRMRHDHTPGNVVRPLEDALTQLRPGAAAA